MVKLRFETDLATSVKAVADLNKATDKLGKSWASAGREAGLLEKAAKRIVDQNLTPQEKYNQKLELMAKAVKAGRLSMEDATKTAERMRARLDEAGESGAKAFGTRAVTDLANYAKGFLGVTAVIGGVSAALRQMETDAQSAADRVLNSLGAFGELQQVSTSPQDFLGLVGQARRLGPVFGEGREGQAADLVFALRNAGYSATEVDFITSLGASRQVKPENLQKVAEGLKKYQDIFGAKEAGGIQAVAQKVFQAAGETQSDFSQIAIASTLFGSEAASLGVSDEEALAAFVAIEKASPGPEEAATRLRSFLNQVKKGGRFKGSIATTLDSIAAEQAKGKTSFDILGESRAVAGFDILQSRRADFAAQLASITGAPTADPIGTRRFIPTDPRLRAADVRIRAEAQLAEETSRRTAEKESLFDALRAETKARDAGGPGSAFVSLLYGITDLLGNERGALESAVGSRRGTLSPELATAIEDYLRRTAEGVERISGSEAPGPSGRQE